MAERGDRSDRLDSPLEKTGGLFGRRRPSRNGGVDVGKNAEGIARFFGTPRFLVYMTVFCVFWLTWNTLAPENLRFDSYALGFTLLTLMLSLQASYSAPLILLAQNRQTDRDRVAAEQDRQRTERSLADTEFLAREMASLRLALQDVATRDYVRGELRDLLEDLREEIRADRTDDVGTSGTAPGDSSPDRRR